MMALLTVTNTNDTGTGSLRAAMETANFDSAADTIQFNIPANVSKTITVVTELPGIFNPLTIDGWSQPGFTAQPLIKLQGGIGVNYGLSLYANQSTVRGLILNGFDRSQMTIWGADQSKIQGNYFGTNDTGTALEGGPTQYDAIFIGNDSQNNVIGVDSDGLNDALERNIIGGGSSGIGLWGVNLTGNRIAGNYIGTNKSQANLGNQYAGIWLDDGANQNIIGSNNDGFGDGLEGNIISHNGTNGIVINGANTERNRISRNLIRDNTNNEIDLGNDGHDSNDPLDADPGSNHRTNFPDLTSLSVGPTSFVIGGKLSAEASKSYRIEFFATSIPDSSGFGGSQKYLGFANVSTNASGQANFTRTINNTFDFGWMVTATATDPLGNSSEFSSAVWDGLNLSQTFALSSNPAAIQTIYLDFNGHTTTNTQWNSATGNATIVTPAFSLDSDPAFSSADLLRIQSIYQRVIEDFRPFNVNVTTQAPPLSDLVKTNAADQRWGIRVAIGGSWRDWYGTPAGGVGYTGSFNWNSDTPVFCFSLDNDNNGAALVADNISHEVGHSLGLSHDGSMGNEYYYGHGTGDTSWNAIMGGGSGAHLTQWSKGDYLNASNHEDDLAIITSQNGFGYIADDFGNSISTATALSNTNGSVMQTGIVSTTVDRDFFYFDTAGGAIDLRFGVAAQGPNLDLLVKLLNSTGSVIVANNPTDLLTASLKRTLVGGRYYISVEGIGKGTPLTVADGYTDYASLGYYSITGTVNGVNTAFAMSPIVGTQNVLGNNLPAVPTASLTTVTNSKPVRGTLVTSPYIQSGNQAFVGGIVIGTITAQTETGGVQYVTTFSDAFTTDIARSFIQTMLFPA